MKKIASVLLSICLSLAAAGQKLDYNVGLEYVFADYEYHASASFYDYSHTLHGVRLTPEVALLLTPSPSVYHRLNLGVDLMRQMGEGVENVGLLRELLFYYSLDARFDNGGRFEAYAGAFPRRYGRREAYLGPIYDSDALYLDPNIEGMMFKYSRDKRIYAELALDWDGMFGDLLNPSRRETFRILSTGSWRFAGDFSLGWTASFHHYSVSPERYYVVDDHLVNPRLEWEPFTWMDDCRLELGGIVAYECNRLVIMKPFFPAGVYSRQLIGKWGLILDNRFYWGDDIAPFYDFDFAGDVFGANIYSCEPGFRMPGEGPGWADWLTLRFAPHISSWLSVEAALMMQFGTPVYGGNVFRGFRPAIRLTVDLASFRAVPRKPATKAREYHFNLTL